MYELYFDECIESSVGIFGGIIEGFEENID